VPVTDPDRLFQTASIWTAVARYESALGDAGRVLLRPSGTERAVRVMVEATAPGEAERIATELAALVASELQTS
jgi:phosphoglucosamine mutase